jgi:putative tryptophan/tyrosine transport system substrate-binding protein
MPVGRTNRRRFIAALGSVTMWPLAAWGQRHEHPVRIGFLPLGSPLNPYDASLVAAFREGLRKAGLIEGRDIVLDIVWTAGNYAQAVAELIQRGAEILVPCGTSASLAAKAATSTIPIVFISVGNPIGIELVDSLARPGGNVTGFSDVLADLGPKLVELSLSVSGQRNIDYVWYSEWPDGQHRLKLTENAARTVGVDFHSWPVKSVSELRDTLDTIRNTGAAAIIIQPSPFTYQQRDRLIGDAIDDHLATVYAFPAAAREGSLIAYGPDYLHMHQRAPFYVDRVLKGIQPADLPVEQPTKFEMVINLKTAKSLGIEIPLPLLITADELIE